MMTAKLPQDSVDMRSKLCLRNSCFAARLAGSFNELVRLVAKRYTFNTDAVNLYSFAVHDEAGLIEFLRQGLHNCRSGTFLDFIAVLTN